MLTLIAKIYWHMYTMHVCHDEIYKYVLLNNVKVPNHQNTIQHANSIDLNMYRIPRSVNSWARKIVGVGYA